MIAEPSVKINLGIDVLRKRPDGYHDIETLFVPYHELHDTLEIVKADDYPRTLSALMSRYSPSSGQIAQAVSEDAKVMITIARKEGVDWSPLDDLTVKAYMEMAKDHDLGPVKIYLEKKSPVGAGLGGGSSDAASAIDIIDSIFYGVLFSESTRTSIATLVPLGEGYAGWLYGKVVDMFYFPLFEFNWPSWMPFVGGEHFIFFSPVFNLADAAISCGTIAILLFYSHSFGKSFALFKKDGQAK